MLFVGRTVVKLVSPEELKLELEREQKVISREEWIRVSLI